MLQLKFTKKFNVPVLHLPHTREKKIRSVNWVPPELGPTNQTRYALTKPSLCFNWDL